MATAFEKAKGGYLDKQAGRKLRREIYEPGGSRDVAVSIEKFLDRKRSNEPFLKRIGGQSASVVSGLFRSRWDARTERIRASVRTDRAHGV
jgi:hypothetical protein